MPTAIPPHSVQSSNQKIAPTNQQSSGPNLFDAKLTSIYQGQYQPSEGYQSPPQRLDANGSDPAQGGTVQSSQPPQPYNDVVELLRQAEQQLQSIAGGQYGATPWTSLPDQPDEAFAPPAHVLGGQPKTAAMDVAIAPVAEQKNQSSSASNSAPRQPTRTVPMNLFSWLWSGLIPSAVKPKAETAADSSTISSPASQSPYVPSPGISNVQYVITGGCIFLALVLLVDVRPFTPQATPGDLCQQMVQPDAVLSRDHLTQILSISERTARSAVQQVIAEPYCRLSPVSIRAGVLAEREAYPLEFDPDTWLVMLYEGEEYAGFDFSFQR